MSQTPHVFYYRVSTEKQGRSGLGLEAQRKAVHEYLNGSRGVLLAEYTEIESGRRNDRPQLQAAIDLCRKRSATLVIAKIDRLARSAAFVTALLDSRVRFIAADMPEADRTFLQMVSVFAEFEARKISERTSAALAAAKARGALLGWAAPSRAEGQRHASRLGGAAIHNKAAMFAANTRPIIESIQKSGIHTLTGIATALNARGVKTQRGGCWYPTTVKNVLEFTQACGANFTPAPRNLLDVASY